MLDINCINGESMRLCMEVRHNSIPCYNQKFKTPDSVMSSARSCITNEVQWSGGGLFIFGGVGKQPAGNELKIGLGGGVITAGGSSICSYSVGVLDNQFCCQKHLVRLWW